MKAQRIKFDRHKDSDFITELNSNVEQYFEENNISKYANRKMIIKTITLLVGTFVPYFIILIFVPPTWMMAFLCLIMGFGTAGIGFSVGHDALHGSYSSNKTVNRWLGYTFNLAGANDYMWKIKHNQQHHSFTNLYGHDNDLDVAAFLRFSPNAPWKKVHRYQHITAFLAYCLLTIGWVFIFDFKKLVQFNGNGSPHKHVKHPKNEVIRLFLNKIFYLIYTLVIPMIVLPIPFWYVLIGFLIMHIATGFTLSIVFQLAHIVEDTTHPEPCEAGNIANAWAVHQLETTANFGPNNKILTWFSGGLNYQVEHHLFPKICSVHYEDISHIVKNTAEKFGITYNMQPSFRYALASHYKTLKRFNVDRG